MQNHTLSAFNNDWPTLADLMTSRGLIADHFLTLAYDNALYGTVACIKVRPNHPHAGECETYLKSFGFKLKTHEPYLSWYRAFEPSTEGEWLCLYYFVQPQG